MKGVMSAGLVLIAVVCAAQNRTEITLSDGTNVAVRLLRSVRANKAVAGDEVLSEVAVPVLMQGAVIVPSGARVHGRVLISAPHAKNSESVLQILFDRIEWNAGYASLNAYAVGATSDVRQARNDCGSSRLLPVSRVRVRSVVETQPRNVLNGVPQPTRAPSGIPTFPPQDFGCATPGAPDFHYISVRNYSNPPGSSALVSRKKTISLPAGVLLELRHCSPHP